MEILGYIAAVLMGGVLGSIGGGGSILTVPILVYLMQVQPVVATGYSLLIVGSAAAFGAFRYWRQGRVDVKASVLFAIPSIFSIIATRAYIMPNIPDPVLSTPIVVGKGVLIMVCFATLMVLSSVMLLRNANQLTPPKKAKPNPLLLVLLGIALGFTSGFLGAGGGFLIIPTLVLIAGLPMKEAVGSSLMVIALNALMGFLGDVHAGTHLQMPMLAIFFACTFAGMWAATRVSHMFDGKKLQKALAYFTLLVAAIILFKELG